MIWTQQVHKIIVAAKGRKTGKKVDSCTPVGGGNEDLAICYKLAEMDDYTWGIIE
ncbi:MAG: hypothetical protein ACYSYL_04210 [Planctomycetota bacterium]